MSVKILKTAVLVCVASALCAAGASAAIIYQDDFSGSSGSPLNGTSLDVGTGTWTATSAWKADGTFVSDGSFQNALLPFTPVAGNVYTLSANVTMTSDQGLMLFFGNSNESVFNVPSSTDNTAGMRFDSYGSLNLRVAYTDPDADGEFKYDPGTPVQGQVAQIVLDTTNALWSASFSYGGVSLGSISNITPGNIDMVGMSVQWFPSTPTGSIDNFTLSVASVPEPSSMAFLAAAGLAAAMVRRRGAHLS